MLLSEWVEQEKAKNGPGAITRLHVATGLAYTTVHDAVHGGVCKYATAVKLSAATGGAVSVMELLSQQGSPKQSDTADTEAAKAS